MNELYTYALVFAGFALGVVMGVAMMLYADK